MMSCYRIVTVGIQLLMITGMLVISGCRLVLQDANAPIVGGNIVGGNNLAITNKNARPNETMIVTQPPRLIKTDWEALLSPLVDDLLEISDITSRNNQLLISQVRNESDNYVSFTQINNIILNLFSSRSLSHLKTAFSVIDKLNVNQAKRMLGIPYDDTSVSRSKMLALARKVKANYLLFTTIHQAPKLPEHLADITMELLSVETGEIVLKSSLTQSPANQQPLDRYLSKQHLSAAEQLSDHPLSDQLESNQFDDDQPAGNPDQVINE